MNDILNNYFEWLCGLVNTHNHQSSRYKKLLLFLHDTSFRYSIARDGNRYEDGIDMRYQYGVESGTSQRLIALALDGKPCSMLEMMVALACRCEQQIMSNADFGNRTGEWFWEMVQSLGLEEMTNRYFYERFCEETINRFLNRDYSPDGRGGLFTIDLDRMGLYSVDLRNCEIWYQATWYLNQVLGGGEQ